MGHKLRTLTSLATLAAATTVHTPHILTRMPVLAIITLPGHEHTNTQRLPSQPQCACLTCAFLSGSPQHFTMPPCAAPSATFRDHHQHSCISHTFHAPITAQISPNARTTRADLAIRGAAMSAENPRGPCTARLPFVPRAHHSAPAHLLLAACGHWPERMHATPPPPIRGEQVGHPPRGVCHPSTTRFTPRYPALDTLAPTTARTRLATSTRFRPHNSTLTRATRATRATCAARQQDANHRLPRRHDLERRRGRSCTRTRKRA